MPTRTFTLPKALRQPGVAWESEVVEVPNKVSAITVTLAMDAADMIDPTVALSAVVESSPDGATNWKFEAAAPYEGHPNNSTTLQGYVRLAAADLLGRFIRGKLVVTGRAVTAGASVTAVT